MPLAYDELRVQLELRERELDSARRLVARLVAVLAGMGVDVEKIVYQEEGDDDA